jgi:anthranilate phosphoribosyltransferase
VAALKDGRIKGREVHPEDAGLPVHPFGTSSAAHRRRMPRRSRALLAGEPGAYRDAVLLNAPPRWWWRAAWRIPARRRGDRAPKASTAGAAKRAVETLARVTHHSAAT